MIKRFRKVTKDLYRGSAPSENDVRNLHKYLKINKIVSLDKATGDAIDGVCHDLGIEHIIIPLNGRRDSLLKLFSYDLHDLLMNNCPTFFHCLEGKDRTGFLAALYKCSYMGWTYDRAMEEAKSLGFGVGVSPFIIGLYSNLLKKCCKEKSDKNDASSIVDAARDYKVSGDGRGSYLDQATNGSFAPFLSPQRQYPYDPVYSPAVDQSPTRENQAIKPYVEVGTDSKKPVNMPLIGGYDNVTGIGGAGPISFYSGFLNV